MNILIIGLGSIAKKHINAISLIKPQAQIFALRSSKDAETYQQVQNIYSLQELTVKPDFVLIANPTQMHGEAINQCLNFNCPLFIEKPVLDSLIQSESIKKEINNTGVITYVACNLRFHPALVFFRKYLFERSPRINEVNIYCGSYLPDWRAGRNFRKIYSANANLGGGAHLDLIHELDYCTWLFGKPVSVNTLQRSVSSLEIDAVDYAQFSLIYSGFVANVILNYYRKDTKREIEMITEEDTITVDLLKNRVVNKCSRAVLFEQPFDMSETYLQQMQYFIDHIEKKEQPMNDFSEGLGVLKIALHNLNHLSTTYQI